MGADGNRIPLRELAERRGILIGGAVDARCLREDAAYRALLAREFSAVTHENAMKFEPLRPTRDAYLFDDADAIVAFAEEHRMAVRGHTLVWHEQLPAWLTKSVSSPTEARAILADHIQTVVGRYRGRILAWDVVNEILPPWPVLPHSSYWLRTIGPEVVDLAFRLAHEADPDARLFLNEIAADGLGWKSDRLYRLVSDLLERGVPIHGVGFQMHRAVAWPPKPDSLAANFRRFADLGLEIHITEMDMRLYRFFLEWVFGSRAASAEAQVRIYREAMEAVVAIPSVRLFATWGATDAYSWIHGVTRHPDAPLLFDAEYQPKPACFAVREVLSAKPS
jgi:endo-1,4-beta-xylanase